MDIVTLKNNENLLNELILSLNKEIKYITENSDKNITKTIEITDIKNDNFIDDIMAALYLYDQRYFSELYVNKETLHIEISTPVINEGQSLIQNNELKFDNKYLFIVPSCIHPSLFKLHSTARRSVYTHKERFLQTIETLKSIRKNVPNAYILLAESNTLFNDEIKELSKYANTIYIPDIIDQYRWYIYPNKGVIEISSMYKALTTVLNYRDSLNCPAFDYILKISGRYKILDNFKIEDFVRPDKITIKETHNDDYNKFPHGVCLILYSIPNMHLNYFYKRMISTVKLCDSLQNKKDPIEFILFEQSSDLYYYIKGIHTEVYVSTDRNVLYF